MAQQIANFTDEQKAAWLARAPIVTADGRALSDKNHMLVGMQCAAATMVAGFQQWLSLGRAVRKGEAAVYIFAPSTRRAEIAAPGAESNSGETVAAESVRFIMVPVFDVSQTDQLPAVETAAA
ncbi:ArdC-like ssDNA-binding domain-containing protein [Bradyrhizobium cenepequi]